MALYGISQEGYDSMRKLADDLLSSSAGLSNANRALKQNICTCMDELGVYGTEIWALTLQLDGLLQDKVESIELLAHNAQTKADEILEIIGVSIGSGGESSNQERDNPENILRNLGVNNVDLSLCHELNRASVLSAVQYMFNRHPELRGQVSTIICEKMQSGTYAAYGPTKYGENFGGALHLNSDYFSNPNLDEDLKEKSKKGWFTPNACSESIVKHELGHALHLEICALACGVKNGSIPDYDKYRAVVRQYMDDCHVDAIVETACSRLGIEFDSWDFSNGLSKYGGTNYGEAIAEAVAEVESNNNPRPLASSIYQHLLSYINNLQGRR